MISKSGLCCYGIIITPYGPRLTLLLMYVFVRVFWSCLPANEFISFPPALWDQQALAAFRKTISRPGTKYALCTQSICCLCYLPVGEEPLSWLRIFCQPNLILQGFTFSASHSYIDLI